MEFNARSVTRALRLVGGRISGHGKPLSDLSVSEPSARACTRAAPFEQRVARDGGDPFAAREQVCKTLHPEVTQAVNETLDLLREAGVVINDVILSKLGVSG